MIRERYRVGDLRLDVGAASIERRGESIRLAGLSFDLLVALARHAPDVVEHDTLVREVWDLQAVSDETIIQRVALVRRALDDDASAPRYVRSVRGRGYALVPEVVRLDEPSRAPRKWPWLAATLVALLFAGWLLHESRDSPPAASPEVATAPLTASELALQGDRFLARHREVDNETAIELYERSLELEPEHPRALIGLSLALSQRVSKFNFSPSNASRALELAERRLAADPDDPRGHYARAFALDTRGQVGPALESYLRAASIDPDHHAALADASYLMMIRGDLARALAASLEVFDAKERLNYLEVEIGWTLALLGFEDAAAIWLRRALDLWPGSPFAGSTFARFRLYQGRLTEADRLAREAIERGVERSELPTIRGHVALLRGDRDEALRFYRNAEAIDPKDDLGSLRALVLASEEPGTELRYREIVAEIRQGLAEGDEWPGSAVGEMVLHIGFGNLEEALAALDRAIDLGYRESAWLLLDPMLADLRTHPGFVERVERIAVEVERQRQEVLAAPWLPTDLLEPSPNAQAAT